VRLRCLAAPLQLLASCFQLELQLGQRRTGVHVVAGALGVGARAEGPRDECRLGRVALDFCGRGEARLHRADIPSGRSERQQIFMNLLCLSLRPVFG
jgi:hypothetical protein